MKVKELIKLLKSHDPEEEIYIVEKVGDYSFRGFKVMTVGFHGSNFNKNQSWAFILKGYKVGNDGKATKDEQKSVVTPKFKVGDTIKELETGNLFYVNSIEDFGYTLHYKNCTANGCTMSFKYEDKYELVEQKSNKCIYSNDNYTDEDRLILCDGCEEDCKLKQKPAWGEEDEIALGDALWCCKQAASIAKDENEMGNAWYAERWLKSIKDRVQPQTKHELSEEDEAVLDALTRRLEGEDIHVSPHLAVKCLKSLKDRVQLQNITVTDEELAQAKKEAYNDALDKIEYHSGEPTFDDGWGAAIWYLKNRNAQPQNTWKPSDEQMEDLKEACDEHWEPDDLDSLYTLYQDLKKLREE